MAMGAGPKISFWISKFENVEKLPGMCKVRRKVKSFQAGKREKS